MKRDLLGAVLAAAALMASGPAHAQDSAGRIAALTSSACYAIERGVLRVPDAPDIDGAEKALKPLGLDFGITAAMQKDLGTLGVTMISRAALASAAIDDEAVVMARGGPQPGCRLLLTGPVDAGRTERVAAGLARDGWREVTALAQTRGALGRRAFVRRDAGGVAYLANLLTLPEGSARLRLVTTVARVPAGVALPPGF